MSGGQNAAIVISGGEKAEIGKKRNMRENNNEVLALEARTLAIQVCFLQLCDMFTLAFTAVQFAVNYTRQPFQISYSKLRKQSGQQLKFQVQSFFIKSCSGSLLVHGN